MDWKQVGSPTSHWHMQAIAEGPKVIDAFIHASGGRFEPISGEVHKEHIVVVLDDKAKNANYKKHKLTASWHSEESQDQTKYTIRLDRFDDHDRWQSSPNEVSGPLQDSVKTIADWLSNGPKRR